MDDLNLDELKKIAKAANQDRDAWIGRHNVGFGVQFPKLIQIRGEHGDYLKVADAAYISMVPPTTVLKLIEKIEHLETLLS